LEEKMSLKHKCLSNRTKKSAGNSKFFFWIAVLATVARSWGYEIKDDREVTPQKPVVIRARGMTYDRLKSLTRYKGHVAATHDKVVLTADEVQAISDNREASANGNIKVVDHSSDMVMTCGNLEYRDRMSVMTAHDHPLLTSPNENGRPITIRSRQMELYTEKKEVVANENVEIIDDSGKGQAEKATFLAKENKAILEDDPLVTTLNGELKGRRIVMNMGNDRSVFVEGMAEATFYPTGSTLPMDKSKKDKTPAASGSPGAGSTRPTSPTSPTGPTSPTSSSEPASQTAPVTQTKPTGPVLPPGFRGGAVQWHP
jgi:lipopolysaccharide export system protein LptA